VPGHPRVSEASPRTTWGTGQLPASGFGSTSPTNLTRTFQLALRYDF